MPCANHLLFRSTRGWLASISVPSSPRVECLASFRLFPFHNVAYRVSSSLHSSPNVECLESKSFLLPSNATCFASSSHFHLVMLHDWHQAVAFPLPILSAFQVEVYFHPRPRCMRCTSPLFFQLHLWMHCISPFLFISQSGMPCINQPVFSFPNVACLASDN